MKVLIGLCALSLMAQQGAGVSSQEKERRLGEQAAAAVRQSKPLDNPVVTAYVKRVSTQLTQALPDQGRTYSFTVVLNNATEPMAFPGGYVAIPANFFFSAQNEDEFATVLAHTIGHIALQHGSRIAAQGRIGNTTNVPLVWVGTSTGLHADSGQNPLTIPVAFLNRQRGYELEADQFGLEFANRANFDPSAFRDYLHRTQPPEFLSKTSLLPQRDVRLAAIDRFLPQLPAKPHSANDEFLRCQMMIHNSIQ